MMRAPRTVSNMGRVGPNDSSRAGREQKCKGAGWQGAATGGGAPVFVA